MPGVRALTYDELELIAQSFRGPMATRNKALFLVQYYTGRRITQTLSLHLGDIVTSAGQIVTHIHYKRDIVKGKIEGQNVFLHPKARPSIVEWVEKLRYIGRMTSECWLFPRQGVDKPLTRTGAYQVYKKTFKRTGINGRLGTHSLRKLYARNVYKTSGNDIRATQVALGHKSLANTAAYIGIEAEQVDEVILAAL